MKKLLVCATLLAATTTLVSAGEILGKITSGGASVGEGATVEAKCGGKAYPAVKTDKSGTYHLVVAETGKCTLTISTRASRPPSTSSPTTTRPRPTSSLEAKDGKLTARRK